MRLHLLMILVCAGLGAASRAEALSYPFKTSTATFEVNDRGSLDSISLGGSASNFVARGAAAPLLALRVAGVVHAPARAAWSEATHQLTLSYPDAGVSAVLAVAVKPTHVTFDLIRVTPEERVEVAIWGPYPLSLSGTIGEIVGVVRDRSVAVGIQALNAKTLGGYPENENDIETGFSGDDQGYYPNLPAELTKAQGFRGCAAKTAPFGSILQAYSRNRTRPRVISNWGHESFPVPAMPSEGVVGSRIALFACRESAALETLGAIEVAEGLPHPMIDGVWGKMSPGATAAYLIVDFGEATVDRAIEMTKRAGLRYLYHSSPFASWGHFKLKPDLFPNGWNGLRECVRKARSAGVRIGFHTLSNFITPSDSYVSPDPDSRLVHTGGDTLVADLTADGKEIAVASAAPFAKASALNAVRIGQELIHYGSVSSNAPFRLLDCQRGAWGTHAAAHARGVRVDRLLDHDYKVLFGDIQMSQEIARQIAALCNETGGLQLSFDGLEGNWSTGQGQFGTTLFTKTWYDALEPSIRGQVINDASLPTHFNWHVNTRMNWGEPWYAGFRESQTLYRFKNQVCFERNFMPHMLGWFALRSGTSVEDAEWLLARAAGFDAGFALATSLASMAQLEADPSSADTARRFGAMALILETMRHWETARMARAFTAEMKAMFRDNNREFHLEPAGRNRWTVQEAHVMRFTHAAGAAASTEFEFRNPAGSQPLQWIIRSTAKVPVESLRIEVGGRPAFELKGKALPPGGSLRFAGGADVVIADASWKELDRLPVAADAPRIASGPVKVSLISPLAAEASLKAELRTLGSPMPVEGKSP